MVALLPSFTFVAAVLVLLAGVRRMLGRRSSRLDRVAGSMAAAASMATYPPSLRGGGPEVPLPPEGREGDD